MSDLPETVAELRRLLAELRERRNHSHGDQYVEVPVKDVDALIDALDLPLLLARVEAKYGDERWFILEYEGPGRWTAGVYDPEDGSPFAFGRGDTEVAALSALLGEADK